MKFSKLGRKLEDLYGIYYDEEEAYFICPFCDEPIYKDDWSKDELKKKCPVCEEGWFEDLE